MWGSDPCFSSPTHQGHVQSYEHSFVFPPSSFILPSFAWLYIFFSTSQVLLSALSWCSACTSLSEDIFLMYPWREMYSTPLPSCSSVYWYFNQGSIKIHHFGQNYIYCDKSSISFIPKFMYRESHYLIFLIVLCQTLGDPPLSLRFSRHEFWSGLPCPSWGDLPNLEIEPGCHVSHIGRWVFYH